MADEGSIFADANTNLSDAKVVILGVPFDGTSSHRSGSAQAPAEIRKESYNFESYLSKYKFDIENAPIHDIGNTKEFSSVSELVARLPETIRECIVSDRFLITIGGEHSITLPIVKTHLEMHKPEDIGVIYFDAHLDFRESYLDEKYSHACVARRLAELVGVQRIVSVGVRSYSAEEAEALGNMKLRFYEADVVNKSEIKKLINETLDYLNVKKIYLTIDMDVLDPAYAPGVGNPEYFGLTPWHLRDAIEILAPSLIGADIVEVSPPYDNGNTAALAAQFIQILISNKLKD